jgi:phosphatidylserine decarboxylase
MKGIHREGYQWLLISFSITALISVGYYFSVLPPLIGIPLLGLSLFVFVVLLQFFRVPHRNPGTDPHLLYAPSDGKVVVVENTNEEEWLNSDCIQVSVFMSPINVHINWYPLNGIVEYFKYHPGKYLVAWHPKSSVLNERSSVGIRVFNGEKILIRQVAGVLARKICCYAKVGDSVNAGHEYGFIKFGSRVDLYIPKEWEVLVKPGDVVVGAETPLAILKS